jgi:hypothetical protein
VRGCARYILSNTPLIACTHVCDEKRTVLAVVIRVIRLAVEHYVPADVGIASEHSKGPAREPI